MSKYTIAVTILSKYSEDLTRLIEECDNCCMYDIPEGDDENNFQNFWYFIDYSGIKVTVKDGNVLAEVF